jgi:hypothetical protein
VTPAEPAILGLTVATIGGLVAAALFAGIASDRRNLLVMLGTAMPFGLTIALVQPLLQLSTTWIAVSVALNAGLALARGALERLLFWSVAPALLLSVAAASLALPSQSVLAVTALLAILLATVWIGWRLRRLRQRTWFNELALLTLLTAVALMAAPTLLLGWRRAGIAAEGQEPAMKIAVLWWPLVVSAAAFAFGLGWNIWMNNRSKR